MEKIKQALGFEGTLEQFFEFIRRDEKFYYSNDDVGRQAYIEATEKHLEFIEAGLADYFGVRPKADLQLAIALERQDLPLFSTVVWYSAYGEGWALYAEHLAREMGAFDTLYSDFGRLVSEMFRAIRLVVDTGLHAKGWTQQQAEQFFFDNSAIPKGAVRSEVRRYLTSPGQATSYKVGMLKILDLRKHAEETLGDRFDIRGFHDVVLGGGALPMPLLEARVNNWIAEQQE